MFFRKRNAKENIREKLNNIQSQEEITGCNPKLVRKVINGKLYDTSKATHICNLCIWYNKIPDYEYPVHHLDGEDISIYKGSTEWFIEVYRDIKPVDEKWIKDVLGKYNIKKYIELFGEPELA